MNFLNSYMKVFVVSVYTSGSKYKHKVILDSNGFIIVMCFCVINS